MKLASRSIFLLALFVFPAIIATFKGKFSDFSEIGWMEIFQKFLHRDF